MCLKKIRNNYPVKKSELINKDINQQMNLTHRHRMGLKVNPDRQFIKLHALMCFLFMDVFYCLPSSFDGAVLWDIDGCDKYWATCVEWEHGKLWSFVFVSKYLIFLVRWWVSVLLHFFGEKLLFCLALYFTKYFRTQTKFQLQNKFFHSTAAQKIPVT